MKLWFKIRKFICIWHYNVKFGKMYACITGVYAGNFFIFIKKRPKEYGFLSVPKMENHWMPKEKFDFAIKHGILEFVENVPIHTKKVAEAQFRSNEV